MQKRPRVEEQVLSVLFYRIFLVFLHCFGHASTDPPQKSMWIYIPSKSGLFFQDSGLGEMDIWAGSLFSIPG
jgi:hypothetical protein